MIILGIDIGLRNFSYCIVFDSNGGIEVDKWATVDVLKMCNIQKPCTNVKITQLHDIAEHCLPKLFPSPCLFDSVQIENQPCGRFSNKLMIVFSHLIYSYFRRHCAKHKIHLQSPTLKYNKEWLARFGLSKQRGYHARKRLSIQLMECFCKKFHITIPSLTKLDDAADALLLALVVVPNILDRTREMTRANEAE